MRWPAIPLSRSLGAPIVLALVATLTVALLLLTALQYGSERVSRLQALDSQQRRIADQLAIALREPVWNSDREQIQRLLSEAMRIRDVAAAVVTLDGMSSAVLGQARDERWQPILSAAVPAGAAGWVQRRPIEAQAGIARQVLGTLTLVADPRFTETDARQVLARMLFAVLLIDILVVALLYALLTRLVLRPLRQLTVHATASARGERDERTLDSLSFIGELEDLRRESIGVTDRLDLLLRSIESGEGPYQSVTGELLRAQDEERRRMGRDLHNSTAQLVAALEIDLGRLRRQGASFNSDAAELIDRISGLARTCREEIRAAAYRMHPPLLDELGLATALKWLLERMRQRRGDVEFACYLGDSVGRLPAEHELALFRVCEEALAEVARRGEVTRAVVRLHRDGLRVTLGVSADGHCGPGDEPSRLTSAAGLCGMRERMHQIGGSLDFDAGAVAARVTVAACADPVAALSA